MMLIDDLEALAKKHDLFNHTINPEELKELDEGITNYD